MGVAYLLRVARTEWLLVAALALATLYAAAGWTPSNYGSATQALAVPRAGPVAGKARNVRSDDWAVATPYFQIAVANDLGPRDEISPYREPLKAVFALPSRDWSMAFKPDLWAFLVVDPAHAFSIHFATLSLAFVAGFALLFRRLGCSRGYAFAVASILFFSQFVQVWWSSNAPVLAWAPWPVLAYLWRGPWWARLPAIAYATAVWLIGQLYPPFILAAGLAFAVLFAAFRPEVLPPARLAPGLAAAALGAAVAWLHYRDLIPLMAQTAYPGQRLSDGGGFPPAWLAAHVLPYVATQGFQPLKLWNTNACEVGVVGSLLPLAVLVFCDHRALAAWARARPVAIGAWLAGLLLVLAWMLAPIPAEAAPLLNRVPPYRLAWGSGLLILGGFAVAGAAAPWRDTPLRRSVFLGLLVLAWAASKLVLADQPLELDGFDLAAPLIVLVALFARRFAPRALPPRRAVLIAVAACAYLTFGQFNPVQPASRIFADRPGVVLEVMRRYAETNPHGWAVAPIHYGAAVNGRGVPAINHVLLQPQLAFFRRAYPDMPQAAFDHTFNRYAHILPKPRWAPFVVQEDLVEVPADPFATPLRVEIGAPAALSRLGEVDRFEAVALGPSRWGVVLGGWADWLGVAEGQALRLQIDPGVGRIVEARGYRLARPDVAAARRDARLFANGFGARLVVETHTPAAPGVEAFQLQSSDPAAGVHRLIVALKTP